MKRALANTSLPNPTLLNLLILMSDKKDPIVKEAVSVPANVVGAGRGTTFQVLISDQDAPNFALRRFVMEPGGGMPNHTNKVEHEQYILKGSAKVGIGEKVYEVKQGDVVYIPQGVPHWYQADAKEGFEFLCIVPNQEDKIEVISGC